MKALKYLSFILISVFLIPNLSLANEPVKNNLTKDAINKSLPQKLSKLSIPFMENKGQVPNKEVKFYAKTLNGNIFITEKDITYSFVSNNKKKSNALAIKEKFIGAKEISPKGIALSKAKVNYFTGKDKSNWTGNIPTFNELSLGEVWNGVELKVKAYGGSVEKLFVINPGTDVNEIKLSLQGCEGIEVNKNGELEIKNSLGKINFTKPYAYQEIDGKKVEVECKFQVSSLKSQVENSKLETRNQKLETLNIQTFQPSNIPTYSFKVASYNPKYPLIIDPLLASTFIGGSATKGDGYDSASSIAIDSQGNIFIAGTTSSSNYPTTSGAYDTSYNDENDGSDIFISKFNSNLTSLLASTYIGGKKSEGDVYSQNATSIAIDSQGNIFVTGGTSSSDYPTTQGAYNNSYNGGSKYGGDVFVSKLNNNLTSLLASTFIGGSDDDSGNSIAIDSESNIIITGNTKSSDFPTTSEAYNTSYNDTKDQRGNQTNDVFVSKLNNSLSALLASTFLGGEEDDTVSAISLSSSGDIYLTGSTFTKYYSQSSEGLNFSSKAFSAGYYYSSFPTTEDAYNRSPNGTVDVFVSKLNNSLTNLLSSTFIGGSDYDYGSAIAIDSKNNVLITGFTSSSDFPTTKGAYDRSFNGGEDVFVSKFDNNLSKK